MIVDYSIAGLPVRICLGRQSVAAIRTEIDALRQRCGQESDEISALPRFISRAVLAGDIPLAVLIHHDKALQSVVLGSLRRKFAIPTGFVAAGDKSGQGSVIAERARHKTALEIAAAALLELPFIHTVMLSALLPEQTAPRNGTHASGLRGVWSFREVRFRLSLADGRDAVMTRVGYKMRRNLGYYRRRAESQFGCRFTADLSPAQRTHAVETLFDRGTYRVSKSTARRLEAMLRAIPGSFAMGIQDSTGRWLSYMAGWRGLDGTFVEWQLNDDRHKAASLSTVLRSYALDHELQTQSPAINFVGATSAFWSRVCEPALCGELVAVREGSLGDLTRFLIRRLRPRSRVGQLQV